MIHLARLKLECRYGLTKVKTYKLDLTLKRLSKAEASSVAAHCRSPQSVRPAHRPAARSRAGDECWLEVLRSDKRDLHGAQQIADWMRARQPPS